MPLASLQAKRHSEGAAACRSHVCSSNGSTDGSSSSSGGDARVCACLSKLLLRTSQQHARSHALLGLLYGPHRNARTTQVYSKAGERFDPTKKGGRFKPEFIWQTNWQEQLKRQEDLERQQEAYRQRQKAGGITGGTGPGGRLPLLLLLLLQG